MSDLEWFDHLVIEAGQSVLFRLPENTPIDQIKQVSRLMEDRFDFPFLILSGDIEITVVDR